MKPEPPADLWEQMDKVHAEVGMKPVSAKPPDSFTAADYAKQYNVSETRARTRVNKMAALGHLEIVGMGVRQERFFRFKK